MFLPVLIVTLFVWSFFKGSQIICRLHQRFVIIIIIIIIIILVITFMHGIYNYVPETNHVFRVYSVAAVLYLRCVLHAMLFRP
jgi:hypothetical protein